MLEPGSWIQHPGSTILDSGSSIQDPGSWIRDHGSRTLDSGSRVLDPGSRILDPGSWILGPGSWIQDAGSWIQDLAFWIQDPRLDPGSWVLDPGPQIVHPCDGNNGMVEALKGTPKVWLQRDPCLQTRGGYNGMVFATFWVPGMIKAWLGYSGCMQEFREERGYFDSREPMGI